MPEKSFDVVLRELRNGDVLDELSVALMDVVDAVQETTKQGEISISLKIKPEGAGRVVVLDTINTKIPKLSKQPTMFYATEDNLLLRNNPKQGTISGALKDVGVDKVHADLKEVCTSDEKPGLKVVGGSK